MKKNTTCNCSYIATIEKKQYFFSCQQQKNCVPLLLHCLFHNKGCLLHRKTVNSSDLMWYSLNESFPSWFHRNHPQTFKKALLLLRYICLVVISALSRKARGSELSKQFFILVCELANQVLLLLLLQPQNSRGSDNATTINHTGTSTPP